MTAVLSSAGAHERIAEAVAECVRLGLAVRPPDVNRSGANFELDTSGDSPVIRFGLATVKNVGRAPPKASSQAREKAAPFTSVEDFTSASTCTR